MSRVWFACCGWSQNQTETRVFHDSNEFFIKRMSSPDSMASCSRLRAVFENVPNRPFRPGESTFTISTSWLSDISVRCPGDMEEGPAKQQYILASSVPS